MSRQKINLFLKQSQELGNAIGYIASGKIPLIPLSDLVMGRHLNPEGLDQTIKNIPIILGKLDRSSGSSFLKEAVLHLKGSVGVNLFTAVTIISILFPNSVSQEDIAAWELTFQRLLKRGWSLHNFQKISSSQLDTVWVTFLEVKQEFAPPPAPFLDKLLESVLPDLTDFGHHPVCPGIFFSLPPAFRPLNLTVGTSTKADVYEALKKLNAELEPEEDGVCSDGTIHPSITVLQAFFLTVFAGLPCEWAEFTFFDDKLNDISLYLADDIPLKKAIEKVNEHFNYPCNGMDKTFSGIFWDFTLFGASVSEEGFGPLISIYDKITNKRYIQEEELIATLDEDGSAKGGIPSPVLLQEAVRFFKPFGILVGSSSEKEVQKIIGTQFGEITLESYLSFKTFPFTQFSDVGFRLIETHFKYYGLEFQGISFMFLKHRLCELNLSRISADPGDFDLMKTRLEMYKGDTVPVKELDGVLVCGWNDSDLTVKLVYSKQKKVFSLSFSNNIVSSLPIVPTESPNESVSDLFKNRVKK